MPGWDLSVLSVHWLGMAIGAGFVVSTPLFKLRYGDSEVWRCLSLLVHFMSVQICVVVPLWVDRVEGAVASTDEL